MAKPEPSALAAAATNFEAELEKYARLGELFLKQPLGSVKYLERANQLLGEIAGCEERLQASGQALVQALQASRGRQEALSEHVIAHVPAVTTRNKQLEALMQELGKIASEVGELNTAVAAPTPDTAREVSERVLALSEKALALSSQAHEAELEEVATQAHALHQKLDAIGKKLAKAGGPAPN